MTNLETKQQVVIYSKTTTIQAQKGYSFEAQQEKMKEYAEKNNLQIVKEFADVGSDKDTKRQGFKAMLKFLESSTDCKTILVVKADKLCRDLKTLCELQEKYEIISACNGANTMVHQLEVMLAEQYSKNLSEVIKAGIQRSKAKEQTKKVLVKVKGE